jgi:hypothetical protein
VIEVRSSGWRGKYNELIKVPCANAVKQAYGHNYFALAAGRPLPKQKYTAIFTWYEWTDTRDPDNVGGGSKPILDALQDLGVIGDDTQGWIESVSHRIRYAESMERVGVLVELWLDNRLKRLTCPPGRNARQITCRIYQKPKSKKARAKKGQGRMLK